MVNLHIRVAGLLLDVLAATILAYVSTNSFDKRISRFVDNQPLSQAKDKLFTQSYVSNSHAGFYDLVKSHQRGVDITVEQDDIPDRYPPYPTRLELEPKEGDRVTMYSNRGEEVLEGQENSELIVHYSNPDEAYYDYDDEKMNLGTGETAILLAGFEELIEEKRNQCEDRIVFFATSTLALGFALQLISSLF
ncbi:hypothetical protein [Haloarcula pellucida]|uniref:Uncharacterized protein n=1 Tax=Haloarcula pellucida TaxID=1427151 RepID=A0A830GP59_9EURY|nr:hypothetical protein [Halomicroarcula pellucida]MBX0348233.1 hypothetical protein [Halomicroarcula pellucida]GGN97614.1 hypothetical protein GCM10009030_27020 [Halomicroarcula pellucida]